MLKGNRFGGWLMVFNTYSRKQNITAAALFIYNSWFNWLYDYITVSKLYFEKLEYKLQCKAYSNIDIYFYLFKKVYWRKSLSLYVWLTTVCDVDAKNGNFAVQWNWSRWTQMQFSLWLHRNANNRRSLSQPLLLLNFW